VSGRPNFYLLLELDPAIEDFATIERRLVEKQRRWSQDSTQGNPADQRKASLYLKLIEDIRTTLSNPESRREEARIARVELGRLTEERGKELDEKLSLLLATKGKCSIEAVRLLVKQLAGAFTEQQVVERLRQAGISIADETSRPKKHTKERLDPAVDSNIRRNIEHLDLKSLYDLLKMTPRSSPQSLRDRANELNQQSLAVGKTDPDSSARKELYGFCLAFFHDEREKEKYDNTLAIESLKQLDGDIDFLGAKDKFLDLAQQAALIERAREHGVPTDDAREYLVEHAAKRKWNMQPAQPAAHAEARLCGYCNKLSPAGAAGHCPHCGEALVVPCPRCGAPTPTQDQSCSKCGCHTGDAPVVTALFKEAEVMGKSHDYEGAIKRLDRTLVYWPDWPEAVAQRKLWEAQLQTRDANLMEARTLANTGKMLAASDALARLEFEHGLHDHELRQRVVAVIQKARQAAERGDVYRRDRKDEEALEEYSVALRLCADLEAARQALSSIPPPAPQGLKVAAIQRSFSLSWQEIKTRRGVEYKVLRRAGGVPANDTDGEVLARLAGTRFDDLTASTGVAWHYAVYAIRDGVASSDAARSGPHQLTAEVEAIKVHSVDRQVMLSWQPPAGARRVEVWRSIGTAPMSPGEGLRVTVSGNSAVDTNLVNGSTYLYRLFVVFDHPGLSGAEILTQGTTVSAVPAAPPTPVADMQVRIVGKLAILTWTPVLGASVQIRYSTDPLPLVQGTVFSPGEVSRYGSLATNTDTATAQITLTAPGTIYFVPFSVTDAIAVAGRVVSLSNVDSVSGCSARSTDRHIILQWTWPAGIEEVLIRYAFDQAPAEAQGGAAPRLRVTRAEYERAGYWELKVDTPQSHHFTIFARGAGIEAYSPGVRVVASMGKAVSVNYRVVVRRNLFPRRIREAWVELSSDECRSLPGLELRSQRREPPVFQTDGQSLVNLSGIDLQNGRARIDIPPVGWGPDTYVKLFLTDSGQASQVRLLPSRKEDLLVN